MVATAERIVILGATGDLTGRYLLPALAQLEDAGLLGSLRVVGVAHDEWSTDRFREHAARRLDEHGSAASADARGRLVRRVSFLAADVTEAQALAPAFVGASGAAVAYLALPPAVFAGALTAIAAAAPPAGSRVVVEKPFGTSLASARELNALVHAHFPERSVFRTDHFLGKQTVLNILGVRFANRMFEPIWHRSHVAAVDIIWDETVALEGRAAYYDHTGALRDMIQNHLLQVLALVAMERPASLHEQDLRDAKAAVLRAVRPLDPETAPSVRARYSLGRIGDAQIPAYVDEPGVDAANQTETFASVALAVDNDRWRGVPFRLRSGKALGKSQRIVRLWFRPVAPLGFGEVRDCPVNRLTLTMDPDRMQVDLVLNGAGDPFVLEEACLDLELADQELSPYARLLVDVLDGDPMLSIRDDEAEECWRIVEPILAAWARDDPPLVEYAAGSSV